MLSWYDLKIVERDVKHQIMLALVAQSYAGPTGDQSDGCLTGDVGGPGGDQTHNRLINTILSWTLIMKYFLGSFSPFHWFM